MTTLTLNKSTLDESELIAQYLAIENAFSAALYHLRRSARDVKSLHAAMGKAQRATTLLKRACELAQEGGAK